MKNPKAMYREPELSKTYFDLLSHKNSEVQKLALECIMSYKHKHLTPYRDSLFNLVDDKNFKNELTNFRVDQESSTVQSEHRNELIPVVMQIVFSKMSAKTGLRTGGKASGQLRRNLVLRFLAGCKEDEMFAFIDRAFKIYNKHIQIDQNQVDLEKFVPPKRLQSSLNLLHLVFEHFGGLMGANLHKHLLKVLLAIGALLRRAFVQSHEVHSGYLPILRALRASSLKVLEYFFAHFEEYPWESREIDDVFETFVWPYLPKLATDGIHSPTALLKLFLVWGSVPKYFPLLVKHEMNDANQHVLKHLVKLFVEEKSAVSVCNVILETLEKLLSLQQDEEEPNSKLPIENLAPIQKNASLNYGSCVLLPYASQILEKLKIKLAKGKSLNQRELFIISRISELVSEADISDQVLELLVPIVFKKCHAGADEQIVLQFLTTISNLLGNVTEPSKHLKNVSPLFGVVSYASGRKLLCQVLQQIAKKHGEFQSAADLVEALNAWDAKWLDQPDFEKRFDGFKCINQLCETGPMSADLGVLLVYNCYYILSKEKDLSLKENASHCFKLVAPCLIKSHPNLLNYILDETLFTLIRNGLRNRNDDVRNECISLLGCISRECAESHVVLRDLNKFTNKLDPEVDCFENLTHLQLHRHARALLKFSQVLKEQKSVPSTRTLSQFVLPLTTFYLCAEKYAGKNSLIDTSIETVGTICKLLPWHQYEGVLKFYLKKLRYKSDYQKQLVKLMVAVLDAFHFDLAKGEVCEAHARVDEVSANQEETQKPNEDTEESKEVQETSLEDQEEELPVLDETVEDEAEEQPAEDVLVCERTTVLCKSAANRVTKTIQVSFIYNDVIM